jgi:hypothetical protein
VFAAHVPGQSPNMRMNSRIVTIISKKCVLSLIATQHSTLQIQFKTAGLLLHMDCMLQLATAYIYHGRLPNQDAASFLSQLLQVRTINSAM